MWRTHTLQHRCDQCGHVRHPLVSQYRSRLNKVLPRALGLRDLRGGEIDRQSQDGHATLGTDWNDGGGSAGSINSKGGLRGRGP